MKKQMVYHNVFFRLKDASADAVEKLIADCHKYLKRVPGISYFAAGRLLDEHNRDVNVKDFHVGTHVTFCSEEAHDAYQKCELHNDFVQRNVENWEDVRVFDMWADYSS